MDIKFWVNAVLSVALIGATVQNTRVMEKQNRATVNAIGGDMAAADWLRYWPIGAMSGLVALNLSLLAYERLKRPKGPFLRGQLIVGSGIITNGASHTINGAALADFRHAYNVAMVCGINDPTKDKYEDQRISVSAAVGIVQQLIEIMLEYKPEMMAAINATGLVVGQTEKRVERPGFRPQKKKVSVVQFQSNTWTEMVLLPKGVDPSSIHKLSDVRNLNGKILSEELTEGRIKQSVS